VVESKKKKRTLEEDENWRRVDQCGFGMDNVGGPCISWVLLSS
jgi:hypothetical protein